MVCVAAFIILCLVGIVVAFLSIFKKEIGKKYLAVFKKAWHCVFKKVRLQKCDTNFKDDVKNTILKKVILKRPKLVKPLSVLIEIFSVLIVVITVWSLVIAIKSLLALWVFGTCNVSKPSACSLTSESCSIDAEEPSNIFEQIGQNLGEWGEIFGAIPDRLKTWTINDFDGVEDASILNEKGSKYLESLRTGKLDSSKIATDIMDPGCIVCKTSYVNQKNSGFFDNHQTYVVFYAIKNPDGSYRFKNSYVATRYFISVIEYTSQNNKLKEGEFIYDHDEVFYVGRLVDRLFTGTDEDGISYQTRLNNDWTEEETIKTFSSWLKEFGASKETIKGIEGMVDSDKVKEIVEKNQKIIDEKIRAKVIPTLVYDGKKHSGLYKV
jgi:hypothetical protein